MIKYIPWVVILTIFGFLIAFPIHTWGDNNNSKVDVELHNTFRIGVGIRVKCNWNGKKWGVDRKVWLSGRSEKRVSVPNNSKCQIWSYR